MARHSRSDTITREEYERNNPESTMEHSRPTKPRRSLDERTADYARNRPTVLKGWLERVEGRFMGTEIDISPEDALTMALRITAGEVDYCNEQIKTLSEDELFERPNQTKFVEMPDGTWELIEERRDAEIISRWQSLRATAMDRMTRYAKMALDVGLEERQMALREREANLMVRFFDAVAAELNLTPDQERMLRPAMRKHLELIESTAEDVS